MTHFPHNSLKPRLGVTLPAFGAVRPAILRDILWNKPVFKAPALPNPRIAFDPLPFTATRITHR
ncbi:MAG TPA: hypothetical protein VG936_14100 [Lacunisphaera sp.]|nr:hypothetical protein [Lacunisphaera sp.]